MTIYLFELNLYIIYIRTIIFSVFSFSRTNNNRTNENAIKRSRRRKGNGVGRFAMFHHANAM